MENENYKKKTTAPDTSVGADDGQPLHNSTENSISAFKEKINGDFQNSAESLDEIYRRIQRLTDPHYLHTISMTELYQTAYQSRPPIIDGLLYAGAYILAEIAGLKQELSEYKSVRSKLRTSDLERENAELRGKVQHYEDVIQRNNLWHFFRPRREKAAMRDDAR